MKKEKDQFENFDEILIKYLTGSATAEERESVLNWIHSETSHQKYFDELKEYYLVTKLIQNSSGYDKVEGWDRVKKKYLEKRYTLELENKYLLYKRRLIAFSFNCSCLCINCFFCRTLFI